MREKKYQISCRCGERGDRLNKIILLFIFALLLFVPATDANKDSKYPFDPAKIPVSTEWEELLNLEGAFGQRWCGTEKIFFSFSEKYFQILDVSTKKVSTLQLDEKYRYKFKSCLPDGRYIVFQKEYRKPNYNTFIIIFDLEAGKEVHSTPMIEEKFPIISSYYYPLTSPDGKYIAWYEKGGIRFGENKITLVPIFSDLPGSFFDIAWSPDSRKIYLIDREKNRNLIVYDVETRTSKKFPLKSNEHGIIRVTVSPDGKTLYFRGILREFVADYLYRLKVDELSDESKMIKPEFLRNGIEGFDLGPDNIMVLNKVPSPEIGSRFPFEFAGIYLAGMDGKPISRLSAGNYDIFPKFSPDGRFIVFDRTIIIEDGNWKYSIHILKRKNR